MIVDAGSVLDERTMLALESADTVVIPVYPEIPAMKSVHSLLDFLNVSGTLGSKAVFVLNNAFAGDMLKPRDIEHALGTKIVFDLPYDPFLYLKAVNEGVPIVLGAAGTPPAGAAREVGGLGVRPGRIHAPARRARTPVDCSGACAAATLQIAGKLIGRKRVSHAEAHPKPHPRRC